MPKSANASAPKRTTCARRRAQKAQESASTQKLQTSRFGSSQFPGELWAYKGGLKHAVVIAGVCLGMLKGTELR